MAFFKEVGKVISALSPASWILGSLKKDMTPDAPPEPDPISSAYKGQISKQNEAAQKFQDNLPQYKEQQFSLAAAPGRQALAQQMRDTNAGMNRRGLLYSGFNQKAQMQNVANLGQQEADLMQTINQNADQLGRDQLYEALQSSMALQDLESGRNNAIYQGQLDRAKNEQNVLGGLLGGVGSLVGTAAARR